MGNDGLMDLTDVDACYRAAQAKDARFDGWFFIAVTTTKIYCRPSCPARTPLRHNIRVYPTAAAAQQAGFRACKRCRPDATPGSPEWNSRSDLVARAMRSIADGVIDREGVSGLAKRLGYSERHLTRLLTAEVGAGPLALARAQRAQTARTLIETTDMSATNIAFASGFASVRQFNDTVRDVFATTPTQARTGRGSLRSCWEWRVTHLDLAAAPLSPTVRWRRPVGVSWHSCPARSGDVRRHHVSPYAPSAAWRWHRGADPSRADRLGDSDRGLAPARGVRASTR
jgi:methylphosphotriester-DNA--protein-cysteine methyltransferase